MVRVGPREVRALKPARNGMQVGWKGGCWNWSGGGGVGEGGVGESGCVRMDLDGSRWIVSVQAECEWDYWYILLVAPCSVEQAPGGMRPVMTFWLCGPAHEWSVLK